ncbi:hypothetical protein [Gemmatimonas sp.]
MLGLKVLVAMIAGLAIGLFAWSLRQAYLRAGRSEAVVYVIAGTVFLLPVSKVQYFMLEQPMLVIVSALGAYHATRELFGDSRSEI